MKALRAISYGEALASFLSRSNQGILVRFFIDSRGVWLLWLAHLRFSHGVELLGLVFLRLALSRRHRLPQIFVNDLLRVSRIVSCRVALDLAQKQALSLRRRLTIELGVRRAGHHQFETGARLWNRIRI